MRFTILQYSNQFALGDWSWRVLSYRVQRKVITSDLGRSYLLPTRAMHARRARVLRAGGGDAKTTEQFRCREGERGEIRAVRNSPICKFQTWNEEDGARLVLPNWTGKKERMSQDANFSVSVRNSLKTYDGGSFLTSKTYAPTISPSGNDPDPMSHFLPAGILVGIS